MQPLVALVVCHTQKVLVLRSSFQRLFRAQIAVARGFATLREIPNRKYIDSKY